MLFCRSLLIINIGNIANDKLQVDLFTQIINFVTDQMKRTTASTHEWRTIICKTKNVLPGENLQRVVFRGTRTSYLPIKNVFPFFLNAFFFSHIHKK